MANASAGTGDGVPDARQIEERFANHGLSCRTHLCPSGSTLRENVMRALKEGVSTIVAGGGDGTVSSVASILIGTNARLGVLPLGTLNHFARDLGIPLDLDAAIEVVSNGNTELVDVALVNEQPFINNASIGVYPLLVRLREAHQEAGLSKWRAALSAAFTLIRRYPLLRVRLEVEDRVIVRRTPLVFVGNNDYRLEGFAMTRRAHLNRGNLCVAITRDTGRLGFFALLLRALFGTAKDSDDLDVFHETDVLVETESASISVATDGEVRSLRTPLTFESQPRALRVIVPTRHEGQTSTTTNEPAEVVG